MRKPASKRPAAANQTALDMNRRFRGPRRGVDLAAFYYVGHSAIAAFAFAITASARFIAALSSSLCHASTDWLSSKFDRWLLARARPAPEAPQWLRLAAWHLLRLGSAASSLHLCCVAIMDHRAAR